jgi:hypothetical protein
VGTVTNAVVTIAKPPPMPYAAGTAPPAFEPSGSAPEAPVLSIGSGSVYYSDSSGQIHVLVYGATLDLENSYTYNADDQLNSITQGMAPASSFKGAAINDGLGQKQDAGLPLDFNKRKTAPRQGQSGNQLPHSKGCQSGNESAFFLAVLILPLSSAVPYLNWKSNWKP